MVLIGAIVGFFSILAAAGAGLGFLSTGGEADPSFAMAIAFLVAVWSYSWLRMKLPWA
jgi:hypothetical protein